MNEEISLPVELKDPWDLEMRIIQSEDDRVQIGKLLSNNKTFQKKVKAFFAPLKGKTHEAHKAICASEKEVLAPAELWESTAKQACIAYEAEQDRIRRIEQVRLEAEAIKCEKEARQAELYALHAAAETKFESEDYDEAFAILEKAEETEAQPVCAPLVIAPVIAPVVSGQSYSTTYKAEVVSIKELCRGVADGTVSPMAIQANMVFLNQQARSLKSNMEIRGVKLVSVRGMSVRT